MVNAVSYLLAFSVNLLAVGPFVKVAYAAAVKPGLLWASEKAAELRAAARAAIPRTLFGRGE